MKFTKPKFSLNSLLILLIALIAYGQTLLMYFWQDDSALIFKLQNPIPASGSFGYGIVGDGPYKYLVTPFVLFFPIFGLNPFGYFLVGLLSYLVVCLLFYLFTRKLFGDSRLSFWSTAIFASGYIGSEIMFRVINSWQTNIGLCLALACFYFYVNYLRHKNVKWYLLGITFFWAAVEFVFIRSHGLIAVIAAMEIFVGKFSYKSIIRLAPFTLIFINRYLSDTSFGGPGITKLLGNILNGQTQVLAPFFANIGNIIIPDFYQRYFHVYFMQQYGLSKASIFTVVVLFILINILIINHRQRKKLIIYSAVSAFATISLNEVWIQISPLYYKDVLSVVSGAIGLFATVAGILIMPRIAVLGLVILATQFFSYYLQYPESIFNTTHRYFSYSLIGFAIFYSAITQKFLNKKIWVLPILIIISNLVLSVKYQYQIVNDRSVPSYNFYKSLFTFVPKVNKGDVFYFDVARDPYYEKQFGDFFSVGSMPETTALAIYYGVDRYDIQMITSLDELVYLIDSQDLKKQQLHSFYFGKEGLIETSNQMQNLFNESSSIPIMQNTQLNINSATPLLLKGTIKGSIIPFKQDTTTKPLVTELDSMIAFLKDREEFYKDVNILSTSEWKFREIRYISDKDSESVWQGHRITWGEKRQEEIIIDMQIIKEIGGVVWNNWVSSLSPVSYTIEVSDDKLHWQTAINVADTKPKANGETVIEKFPSTIKTRYIKMTITKTASDDSPAITEIMALGPQAINAQVQLLDKFLEKPYENATDNKDWNLLTENSNLFTFIETIWDTNKQSNNKKYTPVILDGKNHTFEVIIPGGGTVLKNLTFNTNVPAQLTIENITVEPLTLAKLKLRNLIKEFKEN